MKDNSIEMVDIDTIQLSDRWIELLDIFFYKVHQIQGENEIYRYNPDTVVIKTTDKVYTKITRDLELNREGN